MAYPANTAHNPANLTCMAIGTSTETAQTLLPMKEPNGMMITWNEQTCNIAISTAWLAMVVY